MKMILPVSLVVLVVAALAGSAVFGLAVAYAQGPVTTYTVTHVRVDGARDSAQAVKDANKTPSGVDSGHHEFTLDADATNAEILAAANARSTHSITTGSRYIDASGEVHNFQSGRNTYWLIVKQDTTYTVTHVEVDGARDSAQAVKDANKTASGVSSGHHEVSLDADATNAEILAAANARSTHSITTGSRYIDASGEVHNFQSGRSTYWLIVKQDTAYTVTHVEVDGARDSAQAVKDANKTPSGVDSGHHEFTLDADAFGVLRQGAAAWPFFLEWERRAVRPVTMAERLAPYLRYYSSHRPTDDHGARPVVLVVFDDDLAATHFLRVALEEMVRTRTPLPLLVSHRGLLEREGPLGRAWLAPGEGFEPVRPLTNMQGEPKP